MRKILALMMVVSVAFAASSSLAAPTLTYNSTTGVVKFNNDTAAALPAALLKSATSALGAAAGVLPIAGAVLDTGDLPDILTYLNLPVGSFSAGVAVTPGTPIGDLTFEFYEVSLTTPVKFGQIVPDVVIPEPATVGLAGMGLIGLAFRRRRA